MTRPNERSHGGVGCHNSEGLGSTRSGLNLEVVFNLALDNALGWGRRWVVGV